MTALSTAATQVPGTRVAVDCAQPCCLRRGFAVIDFETSGVSADRDRVVELAIALLDADGNHERDLISLVNPGYGMPVGPTHIHRIRPSDVTGAPTFAELAGDIADALAGRVMVAHNAHFELRFLRAEYARAGLALPPLPTVCTMGAARLVGASRPKLSVLCDSLGVKLYGAHTAAGDVAATSQVLVKLLGEARRSGRHLPYLIEGDGPLPLGAFPTAARGARCKTR